MADINNDIWIDVETLAKLKNITRRAVRLALNQNKYEYKVENIRGGKIHGNNSRVRQYGTCGSSIV